MATSTATRAVKTPGLNVTNDVDLRVKVERIRSLKAIERAAAAAERERKSLEAEVVAAMGAEMQIVLRGNVIAKMSSERTAKVPDYTLMAESFPEMYAACVTEKPYRFLQVL